MTKKHYKQIGDCIIKAKRQLEDHYEMDEYPEPFVEVGIVITCLVSMLKKDNESFDEEKFREYIRKGGAEE